MLALDLETTGLNYKKDKIRCIALKSDTMRKVILWKNVDKKWLQNLLDTEDIVGHNIKFDIHFLREAGFTCPKKVHDTMLMAYILDENNPIGTPYYIGNKKIKTGYNLEYLAWQYLKIEPWKENVKNEGYDIVSDDKLIEYALKDIDITYDLAKLLGGMLAKYNDLLNVYMQETQLIPVICDMENSGYLIDKEKLIVLEKDVRKIINDLEVEVKILIDNEHEKIKEYIHNNKEYYIKKLNKKIEVSDDILYSKWFDDLSLTSHQKVGVLLFDILGIKYPGCIKLKVTKDEIKKVYKTDAKLLSKIKSCNPVLEPLLLYYKYKTLYAFIKDKTLDKLDEENYLRCSYLQNGAVTGRMSCIDPNLQNIISIKDGMNETLKSMIIRYRQCFIVPNDYYHVYFDYKQMELVSFGDMSGEKTILDAVNKEIDIHRACASFLFGEDKADTKRKTSKHITFGVTYGMGIPTLADTMGVSKKEAQELNDIYMSKFPSIKTYKAELEGQVSKVGYITNPFGRRRRLTRKTAYRAVNAMIQGTCADIVKNRMIATYKVLQNTKSKMFQQIHDDVGYRIHKDELYLIDELFKTHNIKTFNHKLPMNVDGKITKTNWFDTVEIKEGEYVTLQQRNE